jgi:TM2 domain-containing membrane protein YozV
MSNEKIHVLYERFRYRKHTAYLLWLVGCAIGLHRIYLKDYGIAAILITLNVFTLGLGIIFSLIDVINVSRRVDIRNYEIKLQIVKEVKNNDI